MRKRREWGEDRISCLTDDLLHKIMSFMNTKYAVQTCVLSKRWLSLWRSLPYLDFDSQTFPFERDPGEEDIKKEIASFNNFITQVLFQRHHTNLVKVRLNFIYSKPNAFMVEGLIAYSVDHNVQQLSILVNRDMDFVFPESFYTSQSLEALFLDRISQFPRFLALPALKSLHLHRVEMWQSSLYQFNFSGCPNLETFELGGIGLFREDTIDATLFINAPNLRRLLLSFSMDLKESRCYGRKIAIDAPRLATFEYHGYAPIVCSLDDLASIDNVYFDIHTQCFSRDEDGNFVDKYYDICPEHVLRLVNTFKEFRHAKSLMISSKTVKVLAKFPSLLEENQLPLSNLKSLKINLEKGQQQCNKVDIPGCVLNFFLNSSIKFELCQPRYEEQIGNKWLLQAEKLWGW